MSALLGFAWLSVQPLSSIVSVVSVLATNLAWAYLGWNAYRGWSAGEEPGTGWALVAGAGIGYVLIAVLATVLSVLAWVSGASNSQPQLVYEVYLLLGAGLAGVWLALLAAFAVGLPAVADEAANADAVEDPAEADGLVGAIRPDRAVARRAAGRRRSARSALGAIARQGRRQVPQEVEPLVDLLGRCVGAGHQEARPAGKGHVRQVSPRLRQRPSRAGRGGPLVHEDDGRRPPDRDLLPERPDARPELPRRSPRRARSDP